jgi:hypothetical protein
MPDLPVKRIVVTALELSLDAAFCARSDLNWNLANPPLDVAEVFIIADRVTLSTLVWLPMTSITIWARKLTYAENAGFRTAATPFTTVAGDMQPGQGGQPSGSVSFWVYEFQALPASGVLADLQGNKGQKAGAASRPADGRSYPIITRQCGNCHVDGCVYTFYHYGKWDDQFCGSSPDDDHWGGTLSCPSEFFLLSTSLACVVLFFVIINRRMQYSKW